MLTNIAIAIGCLGGGYLLNEFMLRKNRNLYNLFQNLKKRKPIAFMETDKGIYYTPIKKIYNNLGITDRKEVIILPKSTVKPCINLGGAMIAHGDLYKSITTPQELRVFVNKLKNEGWSDEDIATFFEEIETTPAKQLTKVYELKKKAKALLGKDDAKLLERANNGDALSTIALSLKDNPDSKEFKKFDIFLNLPSTVKDFIYTGINRVSIHDMIREMVYQRELENLGKHNWIAIAIAFFLIAIGIGFAIKFIFGTPGVVEVFKGGVSRIAP